MIGRPSESFRPGDMQYSLLVYKRRYISNSVNCDINIIWFGPGCTIEARILDDRMLVFEKDLGPEAMHVAVLVRHQIALTGLSSITGKAIGFRPSAALSLSACWCNPKY